MDSVRPAILVFALLGAFAFGGAWLASFTHPALVERGMQGLIRIEVERRVSEEVGAVLDARFTEIARKALRRIDDEPIEAAFVAVSGSLFREYRIFTASNAIAFALLALVAFVRKQAGLQLLLPALAIAGAVALAGGLYLFQQDWLHTMVFGDYVGWGYAAWLAIVASLLADILLNRARVSTQLLNLLFNAIGSAVSVAPC